MVIGGRSRSTANSNLDRKFAGRSKRGQREAPAAAIGTANLSGCIGAGPRHIRPDPEWQEMQMANKEQKRSSREAKKPKQKKKGADKPIGKGQAAKT